MSYNKYYLYKKQVSYDRGTTWEDVTPLETVPSGDSIGTYDTLEECESGLSYDKQYLTFVAEDNVSFKFSGSTTANTIEYSVDSGTTWVSLPNNSHIATVQSGNKVMWRGTLIPTYYKGIGVFSTWSQVSGRFSVEGNVMSLLYGDNFQNQTSLSGKSYAFKNLFSGCTGLTSAENLVLPATTLVEECYEGMFVGCTKLKTPPSLPATTLANSCYYGMFHSCSGLTTAPSLPATTLADKCYQNMFYGCSNLRTAPELPATTMAWGCYSWMFENCTSLNYIKCLATDISATECTGEWLYNVSSSGTFVKASSMSSWPSGSSGIPSGWAVQNA